MKKRTTEELKRIAVDQMDSDRWPNDIEIIVDAEYGYKILESFKNKICINCSKKLEIVGTIWNGLMGPTSVDYGLEYKCMSCCFHGEYIPDDSLFGFLHGSTYIGIRIYNNSKIQRLSVLYKPNILNLEDKLNNKPHWIS